MTAERGRLLTWIENNLLAILMALAAAFSGYVTGMTTTNHRLEVVEGKLAKIENVQGQRTQFNVCAVRSIDKLNARVGIEPACPMEVPE